MEAVLAGLNGEVVTECQTLQTAACERNCQYIGLWCFFFLSFLSIIFFAGRCAYVESKVTDLPYFASKAPWKMTIFNMLSLSSKLMRGGHAMIWLRVFLLVFGVLSQKTSIPLPGDLRKERCWNGASYWRPQRIRHSVEGLCYTSIGQESLQDEFPFHEVISHFYDFWWLWEEGSEKIVKHKAIYILNSFFPFCDLHWCSFVSISKLPFFGEAWW